MDSIRRDSEAEFLEDKDIENEALIRGANNYDTYTTSPANLRRYFNVHNIMNSLLTVVLVCSIIITWQHDEHHSSNVKNYYYYSPALEATLPGSRVTHINITKWSPYNPDSGSPLEHVNGNWTDILRVGMMSLSDDELTRIGGSSDSVRLPPESGGGYMAYLSSHHQLHCLYLLHQSLHQDYYATRSKVWEMSAERRLSHWDHCIDALRQHVQCNADSTVLTHDWYEGIDEPVANDYNLRRCADWDSHFQWQLDRQVPAPRHPLTKPPGSVERPILPDRPPSGSQ